MNAGHEAHTPSHAAANQDGHGHGHGHDPHVHEDDRNVLQRYIFSTDHKVIGIQFLFSGLIFFVLGGLLAMAVRWQLAWPWSPIPILSQCSGPTRRWATGCRRSSTTSCSRCTRTIMIFFVIIPLLTGAFGNFLIPLMIGARDMAFPKLNMFSYWFMWPAFILIIVLVLRRGGRPRGGLDELPDPVDRQVGDARLAQRADVLADGAALRGDLVDDGLGQLHHDDHHAPGPGMTMFRMPMTVWALFITAILQAFALPVLTSALVMQLLDRTAGTNFFSPFGWSVANSPPVVGGGQPLLCQHLFWFYSHPAVYIMILPAMGMVSRHHLDLRAQAALRLQADGLRHRRASPAWASSSGATTCSSRA